MKSVKYVYINQREYSIQKCVWHILSDQWFRKAFSGVVFANHNVPGKRYIIFLNMINKNIRLFNDKQNLSIWCCPFLNMINGNIRLFNDKQNQVFGVVHS